jgi:hypothetical protein
MNNGISPLRYYSGCLDMVLLHPENYHTKKALQQNLIHEATKKEMEHFIVRQKNIAQENDRICRKVAKLFDWDNANN